MSSIGGKGETLHLGGSSSQAGDRVEGQAHGPHAHHLKWGDIAVSGFAPSSEEELTDAEVDGDGNIKSHCGKVSLDTHRRRVSRDKSMEALDAEARRIHDERRYLFRKPRALQYFRGRTLVRSEEERHIPYIFFDLTFVGIIAVLAEEAVLEPTGASLVRYLITYSAGYLIWNWMREIFNAFYKGDLTQQFLVLFVMACLIVYGNNAPQAQLSLSEGPARAATVGSYLMAEFGIFGCFLLYSFHIKAYRAQLRAHTLAWLISTAIWIGCIFVDLRSAIAMAVVALFLEYYAWMFVYTPSFKKLLKLRYSSALNIEHEIERFNDFFTLVMGEFLFSVFSRSPAGTGVHVAAGRAVMAVIIAFCFQLFYMQGGGSRSIAHPIRHKIWRGLLFFNIHLPIVSALTLCGDAMAEFVREEHVENGVRWIACEAYAVGMIGIWGLAMLEFEKDVKGELWVPKWARLLPRLLSGIVAVFLPLTHQLPPLEGVGEGAESHGSGAYRALAEVINSDVGAATESMDHGEEAASTFTVQKGGLDINTTRLLVILTALSFASFLWEQVSSLDGPNARQESAPAHIVDGADDGHTTKKALATPAWRGFPSLFEPGALTFDKTHQRDHELGSSDLTPTTTNATGERLTA